MIKKAKELNFTSNEDLFWYVYESIVNGQRQQARDLVASIRRSRATGELIYWMNSQEMNSDIFRERKEMI